WQDVAFVEGRGTTTEPQRYDFRRPGLDAGRYRIRLKQIDFDGTFAYSPVVVVVVDVPQGAQCLPAYSNLINPSTQVGFTVPVDGAVELLVFDALGRQVSTLYAGEAKGGEVYRLTFQAEGLPSGVYFTVLRFNGSVQVEQMLLAK